MSRFIWLSALMHVWMVALFGNSGSGVRGGAGLSGGFFATLTPSTTAPTSTVPAPSAARARTPLARATASSDTQALATVVSPEAGLVMPPAERPRADAPAISRQPPQLPPEALVSASSIALPEVPLPTPSPLSVEKIPALALEVPKATTPFAVAPVVVEPLAAPAAKARPAIPEIAPLAVAPQVVADSKGFAVYVPPIIEKATLKNEAPKLARTPLLPIAPLPLAAPTKNAAEGFASYSPQPVVPVDVPLNADDRPKVARPSIAPVTSVAAPTPALPVPNIDLPKPPIVPRYAGAPIEALPSAAAVSASSNEPTLETYRPTAVTPRVSAAAAPSKDVAPSSVVGASARGSGAASTTVPSPTAAESGASAGAGTSALLNVPLPPPPAPVAAPSPRLDLDQLRRQAREVSREGSGPRTLLPFPTVAKDASKRDIEKIFDKALKRPDCKDAYADMGLAAVVPLVRDALKDGGCKW